MQSIQDVFVIENLKVINESTGNGPKRLTVEGIFQRANTPNQNQRVYPQTLLEGQIKLLEEAIKERRLVGELDHPTYDMVKLSNASHLITGLRMQGNEMIGRAEILPTPAGKVVEGLIQGGVKIGISSRGMGTLSEGKNGYKTVNDDFKLVTFDIVADPSTKGAYPVLVESKQHKKQKQIIESTIRNVVGERLFLKLLEKKINEKLRKINEYDEDDDDDDETVGDETPEEKQARVDTENATGSSAGEAALDNLTKAKVEAAKKRKNGRTS